MDPENLPCVDPNCTHPPHAEFYKTDPAAPLAMGAMVSIDGHPSMAFLRAMRYVANVD